MKSNARYADEREFSDIAAEKTLANVPGDLKLSHIDSFEALCEKIDYLHSAPAFCGSLEGKRVLEIGCGNGWIALRFAKSGAHVWACDISPKMIELARRYARAASVNITYDTMICEEMTYEDNFFDFVFMHMALHHCDIAATAKQIHRVLKPGGKAIVIEDYAYHPLMRIYRAFTPNKHTSHERPLTERDVSTFVSPFSRHSVQWSGLFNVFETTGGKLLQKLKPIMRRIDAFLLAHVSPLAEYSRIVVVKVVK